MNANSVLRVILVLLAMAFGLGSEPPCVPAKSRLELLAWQLRIFNFLNGDYPESLDAMCEDRPGCPSLMDPWLHPFMYVPLVTGYELYSSGPDGVPNTYDDISSYVTLVKCQLALAERKDMEVWIAPEDPCFVAEAVVRAWDNEVLEFRHRCGIYPDTLRRHIFGIYGFRQSVPYSYIPDVEIDPWGERCLYSRTLNGYVLFSNGPDRQPNTTDDVFPEVAASECRVSLGGHRSGPSPAPSQMSLSKPQRASIPVARRPQSGCGCSVCEY